MSGSDRLGGETLAEEVGDVEILQQHVGAGEQGVESLPARGMVEIDHGAALAEVAEEERQRAIRCGEAAGEGWHQPVRIATGRLDLDDVCAQIGQHAAGQRPA